MTIKEIGGMTRTELEAKRIELLAKVERLVGDLRRYYNYLPNTCWKTEETQSSEMRKRYRHSRGISRRSIQKWKTKLEEKGLIVLDKVRNGKRANLKHIIHKTLPIILSRIEGGFSSTSNPVTEETFSLPATKELSYERFVVEQVDTENIERNSLYSEVNWKLLRSYTADQLNQLEKIEKVLLYIECGLLVLPTHYPLFDDEQVKCSCKLGVACGNIGKHSVLRYAHLHHLNYDQLRKKIIGMFKHNPNWNIGFRVSGYSVLDVDNRHGGDKSLQRLESSFNVSFDGALSVQCSNGKHVYCSNKDLKNNAGILGDGLDVRSEKGFIVAPGSRHKSGTVYLWSETGKLATMPTEWFAPTVMDVVSDSSQHETKSTTTVVVREKAKPLTLRLPQELTSDYVIPEGQRNNELFKWASRERGKGANAEEIFNTLVFIRDNHCEKGSHPVTDEQLRKTSESVAKQFCPNSEKKERHSSN